MAYQVVHLQKAIKDIADYESCIHRFSSPMNEEVESFLSDKALIFEKANLARTFLVFSSDSNGLALVGYFSLAMKHIVMGDNVSRRIKKRLAGNVGRKECAIFLLGQLGKNYNHEEVRKGTITGSELLNIAIQYIIQAWKYVGGRAILVECKDTEKLRSFYESMGFEQIGEVVPNQLLQYYLYIDDIENN